jgi:GH15 family glucan-1,4-alpha-glucosidase
MGDRANFGFRDSKGDIVFLYGHWAGHLMLHNLGNAVEHARPRWNDESYATRICISQLINNEWPSETGWGITVNQLADNEHKVPIIDWKNKMFILVEEDLQTEVFKMSLEAFAEKYSAQPVMV